MRPVTSRNTESASASSIARSRRASRRVTFHSSRGSLSNISQHRPERDLDQHRSVRVPRAIAERGPSSSRPSSPNRSPGSISATTLSRRSIGFDDGDRNPAGRDEVERVGRVALVEQHVAADERPRQAGVGDHRQQWCGRVGEEGGASETLEVLGHASMSRYYAGRSDSPDDGVGSGRRRWFRPAVRRCEAI